MSNNLNIKALTHYASRFTKVVLNEAYSNKDVATGTELLKLTPVRQVNLGILNRLFEQWKSNAESFKSPYFDFGNEEVKEALQTFMNTASQHIAVKKNDLEPLLEASVTDALVLLFTPANYLKEKIKSANGLDRQFAEQLIKYTHIHRHTAELLAEKLGESYKDSVTVSEAEGWIAEIVSQADALDDKDPYVAQFGEILFINLEEIHVNTVAEPVKPAKPHEAQSFFDSAFGEMEPVYNVPKSASKGLSGTAVLSEIVSQSHSVERETLNSRFKVEIPEPTEDKTYGTVQMRVESIAGAIPLGQRFMFVNQLFNKNNEHFEKAVYELDAVKSFEEAQNLIWHRYASKYAWDVNGEAVTTLLNIIKRKFTP